MSDSIADMLTRIRNALGARRTSVRLPHSKIKLAIAEILKLNGFISSYQVTGTGIARQLELELNPAGTITTITRISKPSRRVYAGSGDIPTVLGGRGIIIVSTSSGLMTNREARQRGLGGELICKVW